MLAEPLEGETEAGHHEVVLDNLPSGCYQAALSTGSLVIGRKLTILP